MFIDRRKHQLAAYETCNGWGRKLKKPEGNIGKDRSKDSIQFHTMDYIV